jgi:hypothetical protein
MGMCLIYGVILLNVEDDSDLVFEPSLFVWESMGFSALRGD